MSLQRFVRRHTKITSKVLLFLLIFFPVISAWADFTGKVVGVIDGDTIEVLNEQTPIRIRLHGIDCPEKGQPFGKRAKQAASALAFGKDVTVDDRGRDRYGRTIAGVILPNGVSLNQELVKQGWCWWFRRYAPGDSVLEGLEQEAREAKRGLWADANPVPPWDWRQHRAKVPPDISGGRLDGRQPPH